MADRGMFEGAAVAVMLTGATFRRGYRTVAREAPINLADWGLHCWCLTARSTPHTIIRADNNGQILAMAVGGITRTDLDRKLPGVLESQMRLLEAYGLLRHEASFYTTAFPVFGPETIRPIRTELDALSRRTIEQMRPDIETIIASARAQRHPASAYAMVFGYALDGAVWDELRRRGLLPDTTLDLDHPYWRGGFWAIFPERPGGPGRNDVQIGERTLVGIWTNSTVTSLNGSLEEAQSGSIKTRLAALPVVIDRAGNPVHDAGQRIATKVAAQLVDSSEGRALFARVPHELREQALLPVAHEFIWSVMEQLVTAKIVQAPAVLSLPGASKADVRDLMFVIKSG